MIMMTDTIAMSIVAAVNAKYDRALTFHEAGDTAVFCHSEDGKPAGIVWNLRGGLAPVFILKGAFAYRGVREGYKILYNINGKAKSRATDQIFQSTAGEFTYTPTPDETAGYLKKLYGAHWRNILERIYGSEFVALKLGAALPLPG